MANGDLTLLQENSSGELVGLVASAASIQNKAIAFDGSSPPVLTPVPVASVTAYRTNVYSNVATSILASTLTKVPFGVVAFDLQSNWVAATNSWKCLNADVYFFHAQIALIGSFAGAPGSVTLMLYKNNAQFQEVTLQVVASGAIPTINISGTIQLAVNDVLNVYIYQNDSGAHAVTASQTDSFFTVFSL